MTSPVMSPPPGAPTGPRRELTYSTSCELGGRSQAIGHFQVYYLPRTIGLGLTNTPIPADARHVHSYFIHHVRLQNTGDAELHETVAIQLGVQPDDLLMRRLAGDRETIVECRQVQAEPAGPQLPLTVAPNPDFPTMPSLTASGDLHLHPGEHVQVDITTTMDSFTAMDVPVPAVVRLRGVSVVQKPWFWEVREEGGDPLEDARNLARQRKEALEQIKPRFESLRKRMPLWIVTAGGGGFLVGLFHGTIIATLAQVLAAVAAGVYWRSLVGGIVLLASGVFASIIAGVLLLRKWSVFRERWFWVVAVLGLIASVLVIHLSQPSSVSETRSQQTK